MSANRYKPHVQIIPEDDANRQLANGFALGITHIRKLDILEEAGGWLHVQERFHSELAQSMRQYPERHVVLLLDFDNQPQRGVEILSKIPEDISERVFLLGFIGEPEDMKGNGLGSFEKIGEALANDCRNGSRSLWDHPSLSHNADELLRLERTVKGILF